MMKINIQDIKLEDFGDDNAIKDIIEIESVDFIDKVFLIVRVNTKLQMVLIT